MAKYIPIGDKLMAVDVDELQRLIEDSKFLANLHAAGVDNWDGYHYGYGLDGLEDD